jgi:hypothetical protein
MLTDVEFHANASIKKRNPDFPGFDTDASRHTRNTRGGRFSIQQVSRCEQIGREVIQNGVSP